MSGEALVSIGMLVAEAELLRLCAHLSGWLAGMPQMPVMSQQGSGAMPQASMPYAAASMAAPGLAAPTLAQQPGMNGISAPSTHGASVSRAASSCPHNARSCAHQHACTQQHHGSYACQQLGPTSHASSSRHKGAKLASTSGASVSISATCQARARHGGTRQSAHAWWPCSFGSFGSTIQATTACEDRVPALFQRSSGTCSSSARRQHATWQHHATQQRSPCGIVCSIISAATAAAGAAKGAGCFHGPARPHKGAAGRALPSQLSCAAGGRAGPHHFCGGPV